ncbi:ABC transporter ATP-binding protein [Clostridium akagii]|uniref:ABC transporter ATP-binding protein n=1 Tax=Clostridium akagii TaxID=91623 RepID=UPI00047DC2C0|nr:ABC transporter ATP-binding protein [Clostridium akagii]
MSFLSIDKLEKSFGKNKVLSNVSIDIEEGELVTLLGPSGCGKSTLLRVIAGLSDVDSGDINLNDKDITKLAPKDRNISMVFQSYSLFPNMTVKDNIAFGLKMKKIPKDEIQKTVEDIISLVELQGKENAYPDQLSGGQQQRVALARAIVMKPKLLLMDEPLSALDAKIRRMLRLQIREIQKKLNITTIFVTHDQEEALMISDKIFLMNGGNIEQQGTPEEVYTCPKNEFVARFMGNYNVISREDIIDVIPKEIKGNLFAVRPEAIEVSDNELKEGYITLKGSIMDSIILGNIIRYTVNSYKNSYTVDILNKHNNRWYNNGSNVSINIPYEELKNLN